MIHIDAINHVTGRSLFLDDLPELKDTLFALPFYVPVAHAHLKSIGLHEAAKVPGVAAILTAKDIPGENQVGSILPDEPLFAEDTIHYWGQPAGLIIAISDFVCRKARAKITFDFDPLPVVTDPREAFRKNLFIVPPRTFRTGHTGDAWKDCRHIISGSTQTNGQEHLYLETQGAYARLKEGGDIYVASSTQGPTAVQRMVARVLGIAMHRVEVDTLRIGGGFGGKEDQATPWAVMAALGAQVTHRPVKLVLSRMDDIRMTGKRHPYVSDFKIGLTADLKILAYEVTHYQNAGAAADLSPAILERTLFHSTNAYFIPNVLATAYSCKTNLPPNTAFRGFGGPQGKFVMEAAITKAAETIGVDPDNIQRANLLQDGCEMPYGQIMQHTLAIASWQEAEKCFDPESIKNRVEAFNRANPRYKKGFAMQPICFGISFTNTMMNHARALVHIYQDGSVVVSTGAVEMGQGVNTKLLQVAAKIFGISPAKIKIESANTLRIANTSPTAASAGADLNGKALEKACLALRERLAGVALEWLGGTEAVFSDGRLENPATGKTMNWEEVVVRAFQQRVALSEHAHYATPLIHFDKTIEKGHPFAYHVYGTAVFEVTVDCLRGTYRFDRVQIVHDSGNLMNHPVDLGQIEGGLVQGMGWMTLEEVVYNNEGKLLSNALSGYKVPDIYAVPGEIIVHHLAADGPEAAIQKSKAVGEPPLMYGLGAYFAIRRAVRAFNPGANPAFDAPYTPEKVLTDLYKTTEP